ncbi:hypothetical protein F4776DRAFT_305300 [Hypoxylon sp. NC0597]|nr:hypothetical protein F4776DRAFT_305300 [Hypoxylon sp. NC0597]
MPLVEFTGTVAKVVIQLLVAGYEPPYNLALLNYLLHIGASRCTPLRTLVNEIRGAFTSYDHITPNTTALLPYLVVCLKEDVLKIITESVLIWHLCTIKRRT